MPSSELTYGEFVKRVEESAQDPFEALVNGSTGIYVYALTRDRCAGCEAQKPLFTDLADRMNEKYGDQVRFSNIHVSDGENFRSKLQDFRRLLKFAAYPTYLILMRTEVGTVEIYRGIEPPMDEIARSVGVAVELAKR
jgi:thiol-disulfide isomerase/thioredoxin